MNKYLKIEYYPSFERKAKTQYLEISTEGYVLRNLEQFRAGGFGAADSEGNESNGVILPDGKITDEVICSSPDEFDTKEISHEAFEALWKKYAVSSD